DIVLGTPAANRMDNTLAEMVGCFINTLVLRSNTGGCETFSDYLAHIKQVNLAAQQHQDVPFDYLVEQLDIARSSEHPPLVQIMMFMDTNASQSLSIDAIRITELEKAVVQIECELEIEFSPCAQGMTIQWRYDSRLFKAQSIQCLQRHFDTLLGGVLKTSAGPLAQLPMLSAQEIYFQTHLLNQTRRKVPPELLIHELFVAQAQKTPDQLAVIFENQRLSYRQLDEKSNQLARHLQTLGVKGGDFVGIALTRSLEMVISIYAVLKVGAAYVPLETALPKNRLNHVLAQTELRHILTLSGITDVWALDASVNAIALDTAQTIQQVDACAVTVLARAAEADSADLAYVMFTSGSTGKPKGVMISHRALVNRIDWMQNTLNLTCDDKVLQKTPFAFDISVWEFVWTLGYGGTMVMAKPEGHKDPHYLAEIMAREQITIVHFVPPMLRAYLAIAAKPFAESIRCVISGGEALKLSDAKAFKEQAPGITLHNCYGPTEATIEVSHFNCDDLQDHTSVPIGKPIQNLQLLVLDDDLNLCPFGVPGELHIGGMGLAKGYLRQPQLTATTFITHPFDDDPQARLYKTADLVRYLPSGDLEYLGRRDHQVKLRGFRIEPGEIEAQLKACEGVDSATVLLVEVKPGHPMLVAYLKSNVPVNSQHISEQLSLHLPQYMVPSAYVAVDQWPLTLSGKLDRKALPVPDMATADDQYCPPQTANQHQLGGIWADLLKHPKDQLGINDNFFALGGDSILSIQVVARAAEVGIELSVKQLFEAQTIRQLAALVEPALHKGTSQQQETSGVVALFSQRRPGDWSQQARLLTTPKGFSEQALSALVSHLYQRHEGLRLKFDQSSKVIHPPLTEVLVEETVILKYWHDPDYSGIDDYCT
ncbi:MAG: amino acid adenylation domain-containing protein, partial [Psychrosphaera sp.]|nr:amino acid adenylation domain-containing protein [Psychrosphaera sp.]